MAIIIPGIVLFLAFAYLNLQEEISTLEYIIVYGIVIITFAGSFFIYRKLQLDLKVQETNRIKLEIQELESKLLSTSDLKVQEHYKQKIEKLKKEIENLR